MGVPMLDTLKISKGLAERGMDREQAEFLATAINEGLSDVAATKADLAVAVTTLEKKMDKVEGNIRGDMAKMEGGIREDMAKMQNTLIRWMIGMGITGIGVMIAVLEFKP